MKNHLIKLLFSVLFVVVSIACDSHENYILLQSGDNTQIAEFSMGKMEVYQSMAIDTMVLLQKMRSYEYSNSDFSNIIIDETVNLTWVVRIDKEYHEHEDEVNVSLFFEIIHAQITKLFYVEACQGVWCRALETGQICAAKTKNEIIEIRAAIRSMGFALSNIIRFPYEEGLYDYDIYRFMKLDLQFSLDENEEILKYPG